MSEWIEHEGQWYMSAYPDGSAFNPTSKYLARAGWGVYYAADSAHNVSGHLYGPIQSSYRGEVRAILEIVRTAAYYTIIYCDCESVVNTMQLIIKKQLDSTDNLADGEYWHAIMEITDAAPSNFFRCVWIPSHCNDGGN